MKKKREQKYLEAQRIIFWFWIIALFLVGLMAAINAYACSAYLDYEYVDNMSRVCVYNHLGTRIPYVVSSASMCPLSIVVPHG